MKKIRITFIILFCFFSVIKSFSQSIFHENFENPDSVVSSGNTGWSLYRQVQTSGFLCDFTTESAGDSSALTTIAFSTVGLYHIILKFNHIISFERSEASVEVSADSGVTWNNFSSGPVLGLGGIARGAPGLIYSEAKGIYIAVGATGIYSSTNGRDWSLRQSTGVFFCVTWDGEKFIAGGKLYPDSDVVHIANSIIYTSSDGISWTNSITLPFTGPVQSISKTIGGVLITMQVLDTAVRIYKASGNISSLTLLRTINYNGYIPGFFSTSSAGTVVFFAVDIISFATPLRNPGTGIIESKSVQVDPPSFVTIT